LASLKQQVVLANLEVRLIPDSAVQRLNLVQRLESAGRLFLVLNLAGRLLQVPVLELVVQFPVLESAVQFPVQSRVLFLVQLRVLFLAAVLVLALKAAA
jgi:hypothetical protein